MTRLQKYRWGSRISLLLAIAVLIANALLETIELSPLFWLLVMAATALTQLADGITRELPRKTVWRNIAIAMALIVFIIVMAHVRAARSPA